MKTRQLLLASLVSLSFMTACGDDTLIDNPGIDTTNAVCWNYGKSECVLELNDSRLKWDVQSNLTSEKFSFPTEITGKKISISRLNDKQIKLTFLGNVTNDYASEKNCTVGIDSSIIKGVKVTNAKFSISLMRSYFQVMSTSEFDDHQFIFEGNLVGFNRHKFFPSIDDMQIKNLDKGPGFQIEDDGRLKIYKPDNDYDLGFYLYDYKFDDEDDPSELYISLGYSELRKFLDGFSDGTKLQINFGYDSDIKNVFLNIGTTFYFKLKSTE